MSGPRPGTARGDLAVYDGRVALGFIRSTVGGVFAYDVEGRTIGSYANQRAAQAGLRDRATGKAVAP